MSSAVEAHLLYKLLRLDCHVMQVLLLFVRVQIHDLTAWATSRVYQSVSCLHHRNSNVMPLQCPCSSELRGHWKLWLLLQRVGFEMVLETLSLYTTLCWLAHRLHNPLESRPHQSTLFIKDHMHACVWRAGRHCWQCCCATMIYQMTVDPWV